MSDKSIGVWHDIGFLAVCEPRIARLYHYWDSKRAGRDMPARADLDPIEMREWLGSVILYDVLRDPVDFRYRLFGTHLVSALGTDLTGRLVSQHSTTDDKGTAVRALAELVEQRSFRFRNDTVTGYGRRFLSRDRIHLPLSDDGGETVTMILSYIDGLEMIY